MQTGIVYTTTTLPVVIQYRVCFYRRFISVWQVVAGSRNEPCHLPDRDFVNRCPPTASSVGNLCNTLIPTSRWIGDQPASPTRKIRDSQFDYMSLGKCTKPVDQHKSVAQQCGPQCSVGRGVRRFHSQHRSTISSTSGVRSCHVARVNGNVVCCISQSRGSVQSTGTGTKHCQQLTLTAPKNSASPEVPHRTSRVSRCHHDDRWTFGM